MATGDFPELPVTATEAQMTMNALLNERIDAVNLGIFNMVMHPRGYVDLKLGSTVQWRKWDEPTPVVDLVAEALYEE